MIKNSLFLVCFCFVLNSFSQDKTRDEIIQLMAEDTCECIKNDKSSFTKEKTMNQKQVALGLCLIKSYNIRKGESKDFKKGDMKDFEALGEEVGLNMVSTCGEDFMAIFSDNQLGELIDDYSDDNDDVGPPPPPPPKNENDLQLEAELISLNNDAISYFIVKDSFDKTHIFLINEQFEGYKLLKKSNYNESLKIYYKEIDLFDISEQKYVKKKVVKYIEVIN